MRRTFLITLALIGLTFGLIGTAQAAAPVAQSQGIVAAAPQPQVLSNTLALVTNLTGGGLGVVTAGRVTTTYNELLPNGRSIMARAFWVGAGGCVEVHHPLDNGRVSIARNFGPHQYAVGLGVYYVDPC